MRHDYELSEATRKTLTNNVTDIAEEANVSTRYLHAILAGDKTDPFAPFEHLYQASARAGVSRCHWRNRLDAIDAKYDKQHPKTTHVECLATKIQTDADTTAKMVEAMKDGRISKREAENILEAIRAERRILEVIELTMQLHVTADEPSRNARRVY